MKTIQGTYYKRRSIRVPSRCGLSCRGKIITPYVEYAELTDRGKGASIGFRGNILELVDYRAEYRDLGVGFVPGYFTVPINQHHLISQMER